MLKVFRYQACDKTAGMALGSPLLVVTPSNTVVEPLSAVEASTPLNTICKRGALKISNPNRLSSKKERVKGPDLNSFLNPRLKSGLGSPILVKLVFTTG